MTNYKVGSRCDMNSAITIGILLVLPLVFGALFQRKPKTWAINHASIAMLEIAGFVVGLVFILAGVLR